jgi:hypothetical protein
MDSATPATTANMRSQKMKTLRHKRWAKVVYSIGIVLIFGVGVGGILGLGAMGAVFTLDDFAR